MLVDHFRLFGVEIVWSEILGSRDHKRRTKKFVRDWPLCVWGTFPAPVVRSPQIPRGASRFARAASPLVPRLRLNRVAAGAFLGIPGETLRQRATDREREF